MGTRNSLETDQKLTKVFGELHNLRNYEVGLKKHLMVK